MVMVKFKTQTGDTHELDCCAFDCISDIMDDLRRHCRFTGQFVLFYQDKQLSPLEFFSEIGWVPDSHIEVRKVQAASSRSRQTFGSESDSDGEPISARRHAAKKRKIASDDDIDDADDEDPPEFALLVEPLVDMGFPKAKVEAALRRSAYDAEKAVTYLVSASSVKPKSTEAPEEIPDLGELQDTYNTLTSAQKKVLLDIQKSFQMDLSIILQVYDALDRQRAATVQYLKSMI
jgi:hypothetical protein